MSEKSVEANLNSGVWIDIGQEAPRRGVPQHAQCPLPVLSRQHS